MLCDSLGMKKKSSTVKAAPIQAAIGNLYPSMMTDTVAGKKITQGSMFMVVSAGEVKTEYNGKKETIALGSGLNGATILMAKGRYFVLDLQRFLQDAIDCGLLAETLDFNRET